MTTTNRTTIEIDHSKFGWANQHRYEIFEALAQAIINGHEVRFDDLEQFGWHRVETTEGDAKQEAH